MNDWLGLSTLNTRLVCSDHTTMSKAMLAYHAGWTTSVCADLETLLESNYSISVSQESKKQILQPLSVLRPKFRVSALNICAYTLLTSSRQLLNR